MAEFTTTQEERDAASYLDWDDETLGKFTKYIALQMAGLDDEDGFRRVTMSSSVLSLVRAAHETNAGTLTLKMENITLEGAPIGNWQIKIKSIK